MSLLPEQASFEERVQDYFLAVRGAGLMLSALDAELLYDWSARRIPFEVVARGIAQCIEKALWDARPGEPLLRSLRACRKQVEKEIRQYLDRVAGVGEGGVSLERSAWENSRCARLKTELEALAALRPDLSARARGLQQHVAARMDALDAWQVDQLEVGVHLGLLRALPFLVRRRLWRTACGGAGSAGGLSPGARRLARRVRLQALVRQELGREVRLP